MRQQKEKVFEAVARQIQQQIEEGVYQIGDQLPSERELANQYACSRTSIREALKYLQLNGFVDIRHGDGTFVIGDTKKHDGKQLLDAMGDVDESISLFEMLEVRLVIETQCAALAAVRANGEDIKRIADALEQMRLAETDFVSGIEADFTFHLSIARATHNSILYQLVESLESHMRKTIELTRYDRLVTKKKYAETFEEHKQIYSAISRGDAQLAQQLMEQHIRQIRQELAELRIET